ncbi:MAG: quinone oxidoreductase family protein [Acidimicrobiales bacterium]
MRAVVVEEYGSPEVLVVREMPEPEPGPGEVSITVGFVGVNFTDVRNRVGDGLGVLPFVPGVEASGTVRKLGPGVEGLRPGQPVAAFTRGEAYAEVTTAQAALTVPLPDGLAGRPESAGMMVALPVAILLLRSVGRVTPGELVLVHSAAGGVGTALGQLARLGGLRPLLGTVGHPDKAGLAREHGYSTVCGYDDFDTAVLEETAGRGVDVVLDPVGGEVRARSFELLAPFGRLVSYSNISREPERIPDTNWLRARCIGCIGFSGGQLSARTPLAMRPALEEAVSLVASGDVTIPVTSVFQLADATKAHEIFERRAASGKLVLEV